jgi:hypothetical protein
MWHTIGLGIGGPAVFDPGCMMMSRIETVLNPAFGRKWDQGFYGSNHSRSGRVSKRAEKYDWSKSNIVLR